MPIKNEEEAYEKIVDICRNNDYTTLNSLVFAYFKKDYRLIAIDLSKPTKLKDPQQINFISRLERQDSNNSIGETMFFIIEKSEETTFSDCNWTRIQNYLVLKQTVWPVWPNG